MIPYQIILKIHDIIEYEYLVILCSISGIFQGKSPFFANMEGNAITIISTTTAPVRKLTWEYGQVDSRSRCF